MKLDNNVIQNVKSEDYILAKEGINHKFLLQRVEEYFGEIPFEGKDTFRNIPLVVDSMHRIEYTRLSKLLNDVLEKIVANYFHDERIRSTYQLDEKFEAILRLAETQAYKVGMFRPDFLIDKTGQAKICEIGCRYPINGWMLSYYMSLSFKELSPSVDVNWQILPEQLSFINSLSNDFDQNKNICYVHNKEKGTEAYQLFNELDKKGFKLIDTAPNNLELTAEGIYINGQKVSQFILEMDREELKAIDPDILKAIIKSDICINDVRSLILVHDKQILSILYDEEIVKDYLSEEDHDFIKRYLVPAYTLNSKELRNDLVHSTENWVLKKNSGGRGIDMYVKNECTPETWQRVITSEWKDYMVQKFVDQKVFDLEQSNEIKKINIVGMLLCYNKESFGPGIFRGSTNSIINVHSGGYILPCVYAKD